MVYLKPSYINMLQKWHTNPTWCSFQGVLHVQDKKNMNEKINKNKNIYNSKCDHLFKSSDYRLLF